MTIKATASTDVRITACRLHSYVQKMEYATIPKGRGFVYARANQLFERVLTTGIVKYLKCSMTKQWVTMWVHTLSPKMVWQIQTQRTTTKSTVTATSLSQLSLSVNRSCRTYTRCVWCSSATHDLFFRAVRAPAFLCFLCRSAWATSLRFPNMPHWHRHGLASVLVEVTCCRRIYYLWTVFFVIALSISFRLILITLMIILTTCVCSLVLLQTTTFDKIERDRSIYSRKQTHRKH